MEILLDAERTMTGVNFNEDATIEDIQSAVVSQVLGLKFVEGRTNDYIVAAFQIIRDERMAAPPAVYPRVGPRKYH